MSNSELTAFAEFNLAMRRQDPASKGLQRWDSADGRCRLDSLPSNEHYGVVDAVQALWVSLGSPPCDSPFEWVCDELDRIITEERGEIALVRFLDGKRDERAMEFTRKALDACAIVSRLSVDLGPESSVVQNPEPKSSVVQNREPAPRVARNLESIRRERRREHLKTLRENPDKFPQEERDKTYSQEECAEKLGLESARQYQRWVSKKNPARLPWQRARELANYFDVEPQELYQR